MRTLLVMLALLAVPPCARALEGRVEDESARPVPAARVELAGAGRTVTTGEDGRFVFEGVEPPVTLVVGHPRFATARVRVAEPAGPITIRLTAHIAVRQEIAVRAERPSASRPPTLPASDVDPRAVAGPLASVAGLAAEVPGVSQSGQGGLLQPVSIRGESRQRVLTFVGGMRVVTDRRAGTAASFVDPLLLGSVSVLRGPAVTTRGAGALGGALELWPGRVEGTEARAGYETHGDASHVYAGWGEGRWSVAGVHRRANGGRAADGTTLDDFFSQSSAAVRGGWDAGTAALDLLVVAAAARDVGKASTDAPARTTVYPEDDHVLVRLGARTAGGWRVAAWTHASDLVTRVEESAATSLVVNRSDDFGVSLGRSVELGAGVALAAGLDHFGRRGVSARETSGPPGDPSASTTVATLDGGREDETGLHGRLTWARGRTRVDAGLRVLRHESGADGAADVRDVAGAVFGGVLVQLGEGLALSLHAGSGVRYPSLGERFFSGTTGRGTILGNPGLERERSVGLDAGLRWTAAGVLVTAHLFQQRVDDLVQRIETQPDVLTFVNAASGRIRGVEIESATELGGGWGLEAGGHALTGEDEAGRPLEDVPASRMHLGARKRSGRWTWRVRLEHRAAKGDVASGEKRIPEADLLSSSLEYRHPSGVSLRLAGSNLLDEEFFSSADRKVPLSPGRSVGVSLGWSR